MKDLVATITNSPFGIKILDTLFSMPIFRSTDFRKISGLNQQTTFRIITRFSFPFFSLNTKFLISAIFISYPDNDLLSKDRYIYHSI